MAGVAHRDPRLAAAAVDLEPHAAIGIGGIQRVLHHMADDTLEPLFVPAREHPLGQSQFELAAPMCGAGFDALCHAGQVHAEGRAGRCGAFAQLEHELSHLFEGVLDCHQHVLLEFGVGMQPLGVFHHQ